MERAGFVFSNQRCEGVRFSLATCLGWTHIEEEREGWWLQDAVHARRVSSPFKVIGLGLKHLKMQKKQATIAAPASCSYQGLRDSGKEIMWGDVLNM